MHYLVTTCGTEWGCNLDQTKRKNTAYLLLFAQTQSQLLTSLIEFNQAALPKIQSF